MLAAGRGTNLVDYALQRRAALVDLRSGRRSRLELCDAHPHLKLAARHYGQRCGTACPVCQDDRLCEVSYVYGEELRTTSGQAKLPGELAVMNEQFQSFTVYTVEVCVECGWNHLMRSYTLGRGAQARATGG
jgi:Family of unknown function (DUF5318)